MKQTPNCSKKYLEQIYVLLYEKNAFRFNFEPWKVPQPEKCMKVKVHVFWLRHFPRSKIKSEKSSHKVWFNYCFKFFLWAFLSILKKATKKRKFPIAFSNIAQKGCFLFQASYHFFVKRLILTSLTVVGSPQFDYVITTYTYPLLT